MITFYPETHQYLVDGILVPSVTQLIREYLGANYEGVPKAVLDRKAEYGNRIHGWIEAYLTSGDDDDSDLTPTMRRTTTQIGQFKAILETISTEQLIHYKTRFCGTYDLLAIINGKVALIDIKTTAKYDSQYLEMQLGFYKLALAEAGTEVDETYCLWCPKNDLVKLIPVDAIPKNKVEEILDEIARKHSPEELPY